MNLPRFFKIGNKLVPAPKRTRKDWISDILNLLSQAPNIKPETKKCFREENIAAWSKREIDELYLGLRKLFGCDDSKKP